MTRAAGMGVAGPVPEIVLEPDGAGALGGLGLLLALAVAWGVNWPVSKFVLSQVPPFSARGWAGIAGAAVAFALAWGRGEALWPRRGQWVALVLASLLNVTAWMGLAVLSLLWLPASEAVIVAYTLPVGVALLARGRPGTTGLAGVGLGLAGIVVLLAADAPAAAEAELPGMACLLGAALCLALGGVLARRAPVGLPPVTGAAWQIGLGSLPLLGAALAFERLVPRTVGPLAWAGMAYTAAAPLACLGWFAALRRLPPGVAGFAMLLVPVAGVFSAALLLGENLGWRVPLALALTLTGGILATRG